MNYAELTIIALALAMDAAVYSFSCGLITREERVRRALALAATVGLFQGGMLLLGYGGGCSLRQIVAAYAPWVVLAIFLFLGISIIRNAWMPKDDEEQEEAPHSIGTLLLVGIATSIDALAVGGCIALGELLGGNTSPLRAAEAAAWVGGITLLCSLAAFGASSVLHKLPVRALETLGGLLLIGLGVYNVL